MTGTNCDLFTHKSSRSYLNHLVQSESAFHTGKHLITLQGLVTIETVTTKMENTRWFKYDRDDLCVNKSQFVPVIFEPPCIFVFVKARLITKGCQNFKTCR
jgi:hypothetical protein